MIFSFVILHYGNASITQQAISSIERLESFDEKSFIVVVDNASPNETGKNVCENNQQKKYFIYIKNKENLGYAKGNNIGFTYAKNVLHSDFIILMNNDTIIESQNFYKLVADDFIKESFAVLGPYIHTPSGKKQNPLRKKMLEGFRLKLTQIYLRVDQILTWLCIGPLLQKVFLGKAKKIMHSECAMNGVELHGSFLIFSPIYIQKFDGLNDRTFMYCEEEFLFARCVANGLKSRYNPAIRVFHNDVGNTNSSALQIRRKSLFRIENCIKSLKIYSKLKMDEF